MARLRALDLFCCAGGASMGLHRAGFDVVGVDIVPRHRYPFAFVQANALQPPFDLAGFDFIWASPPCQAYSAGSLPQRRTGTEYPDLVEPTRAMLASVRGLTVIENVPGAPVRADLVLDGTMFPELRVIRRRIFETNFPIPMRLGFDASAHVTRHGWSSVHGNDASSHVRARRRKYGVRPNDSFEQRKVDMGIDWMGRQELSEAIPPAYSEYIGRAAINYIEARRAA